jgi:hypothetical protein
MQMIETNGVSKSEAVQQASTSSASGLLGTLPPPVVSPTEGQVEATSHNVSQVLSSSAPVPLSTTTKTSSLGVGGSAPISYRHVHIPFRKDYPTISEWLPALDADPNHNSPTRPQQFSAYTHHFKQQHLKTIDEIALLGFQQVHLMLGVPIGDALHMDHLAREDLGLLFDS